MKKILLLSPKDNNFYNFRSELILKLQDMGYEVVLSCPYGKKMEFFIENGCRFVDLEMDRRGKSVFKDFKLLLSYNKLMKQERPDIVLMYTSKPSIYGGVVCGLRKIPYIVNNAGLMEVTGIFGEFMKLLYRIGFRKASCIMFQNTRERDFIKKLLGENIYYRDIPGSGVNLKEFSFAEYPDCRGDIIFNYVARIVKIKGIDEFLECAIQIKRKYTNIRFILYGDYDDEEYKEKISEMEKQGIIEYGGVQLDMKPAIRKAHAVIHPSYYEGMTNVVLEHSAMGRPCLGADIPGVREAINDGKSGYVFAVKNVNAMVEKVEKFIRLTYEEKKSMGKAAREKMEKEFDREYVTNIYVEEIQRILFGVEKYE